MKQPLRVFKIGGAIINQANLLDDFLTAFCSVEGPKLLVHGGGRKATELAKRLQIETKMIEGRRITDAPTLEVVTMVYAGLINKNIVSQLQAKGTTAIGLCGADLGIITASKRVHPTIDYGFVGDITAINAMALNNLLQIGATPVICALSDNANGQLLNTNADTIVSRIASAMNETYEVSLNFVFEFDGVMKNIKDSNSLISNLPIQQFAVLKQEGIINDGMIPKLQAAINAKETGVHTVRICSIQNMLNNVGTTITT